MVATVALLIFVVPVWPLWHGPQSGTITGPAVPGFPLWMWAASALPVRCAKVSFHFSTAPLLFSTYVPVNEPFAPGAGFALGTSTPVTSIPLTLWTNWTAASWTSSCVVGGSKLYRVRMFRHMGSPLVGSTSIVVRKRKCHEAAPVGQRRCPAGATTQNAPSPEETRNGSAC